MTSIFLTFALLIFLIGNAMFTAINVKDDNAAKAALHGFLTGVILMELIFILK